MGANEFKRVLLGMQDSMFSYAFALTSDRDDAQDLLQDTTLKALDSRDQYSEKSNFKGWVFTIMRNLFINNFRHTSRIVRIESDAMATVLAQNTADTESQDPARACAVTEINEAISLFPEEYRLPFSMHVAGYKYFEIAEIMNLPLGTVKSRIFSARRRLQDRFADYL